MRTLRLPGWETLSGARVAKRARRAIQVGVLVAVALPTLAVVAGLDLGIGPAALGPPGGPGEAGRHVALSLAALAVGLLGGVLALFVLGRRLGGVDDDLWILAPALLAATPFELYRALAAWRLAPGQELEAVLATAWWLPRTAFVSLLLLGLLVALLTRPGTRARRLATGGLASAALGLAADGVALLASGSGRDFVRASGEVPVRPLAVVPLGLWLIVAASLAPSFHRRHRSALSYGFLAACLPQLVAELATAFVSLRPFDSAFVLAHGLELVAAAVLLAVVVLDQAMTFNSHLKARATAEERARQLEATTARLHRLDLDLLATTERQRRQDALLAASNARLTALLESAHDLVQSVAADGRFEFVNRAWLETLGYAPAEVAELSLWQVLRPDHHGRYRAVLEGLSAGEGPARLETVFLTRHGREIPVEGGVSAHRDGDEPIATLGIFRDISDRQRVDRMKEEFVSTVSHELRTPLTSIIAALGLVEGGRLPDGEARSLLAIAHRNGKRLLDLINDLLDAQKLASGRMEVAPEPIAVGPALEELKADMAAFAELHQVRIEIDPVEPGLAVLADRTRLRQIFFNLVSNAIKFSPQGEEVRLGAAAADGCVRFSVADNGPGIPPEFRTRLFEKFARADASPNRRTAGTGLGLAIVKGLTERMGGDIRLVAAAGPGTLFEVDLPTPSGDALPPSGRR